MDELLELLLTPLDEPRRQAVWQSWQTHLRENGGDNAALDVLAEALQDYPEDYPPNWKALGEVEWQIQATLPTLGVGQPLFVSQLADQPGVAVPAVLSEAAVWLQIETGGDEYLAVPVRSDLLAEVLRVAHSLSISIHLIE